MPTTTTIPVTPGTGINLDGVTTSNGVREIVTLGDPSTQAAYAAVENADPGSSDYGLVVRNVRGVLALPFRTDPTGTTTQPVSGTVAVSNFPASQTVTLTSTTVTGTVAVTQSTSPWVVSNGGTFATQATLAAETTKVIGTVNQGTSPWVVSLTSTTITGTAAVTQSGTWTVGISAAQTIAVTQATASSLNATVVQGATAWVSNITQVGGATQSVTNPLFVKLTDATTGVGVIAATTALKSDNSSVAGTATVTAAAGVQKVGIVGNANATIDAAVGTLPTNNLAHIAVPTAGAGGALSCSLKSAQATAVNIKASAGNLYGFAIVSATATAGFVEFFNTATTATAGAVLAVPIAASGTIIISPSQIALLNFSTGIAINVATPLNGTTTQITWTGSVWFL